jgi:two-component system response regulator HydG
MPLEMQAKLLRALQERTVRPVGSNTEVPFDARIVAATNRDLEEEIFHKRFREDLYFRINVVKIDLPPLRERAKDVLELAAHFVESMAKRTSRTEPLTLSVAAAEKLLAYEWPGNVRELENCIERAVAMARFHEITPEDLPERIRAYRNNRVVISAETMNEIVTVDELERRYIGQVLKLVGGNKSKAAQMLGLDRRTLYRKLDRYDVTNTSPTAGTPTPGPRVG